MPVSIDSWEDQDWAEYTVHTEGGSSVVSTSTNNATDGSYSGFVKAAYYQDGFLGSAGAATAVRSDVVFGPSEATYAVDFTPDMDNQVKPGFGSFAWGVRTADGPLLNSESYQFRIMYSGQCSILRNDGGSSTELASTSISPLSDGVTYRFELEWNVDGSMTTRIIDGDSTVAELSATDTTYGEGGIGFQVESDSVPSVTSTRFDNARLLTPRATRVQSFESGTGDWEPAASGLDDFQNNSDGTHGDVSLQTRVAAGYISSGALSPAYDRVDGGVAQIDAITTTTANAQRVGFLADTSKSLSNIDGYEVNLAGGVVQRVDGGTRTTLDTVSPPSSTWIRISVVPDGDLFTLVLSAVNGSYREILRISDATYRHDGFFTQVNSSYTSGIIKVDNIRVGQVQTITVAESGSVVPTQLVDAGDIAVATDAGATSASSATSWTEQGRTIATPSVAAPIDGRLLEAADAAQAEAVTLPLSPSAQSQSPATAATTEQANSGATPSTTAQDTGSVTTAADIAGVSSVIGTETAPLSSTLVSTPTTTTVGSDTTTALARPTSEVASFGQTTLNGKSVTYERDANGTWVCVLNYEHLGGESPSVGPTDTFPQLPNGRTTANDVSGFQTSGETRHVDKIDQYGSWDVDAVRLEATTTNHGRKIHFYTTNTSVVDAVLTSEQPDETDYTDFQGDTTTLYGDHTANLPASAGNGGADTRSDRIFGDGFPMYNSGTHHWAVAGFGNRWEVDDYPGDASNSTVHRVWVRVPDDTIGTASGGTTTTASVDTDELVRSSTIAQLSTPVVSALLEAADAAQAEAPSMATTTAAATAAPARTLAHDTGALDGTSTPSIDTAATASDQLSVVDTTAMQLVDAGLVGDAVASTTPTGMDVQEVIRTATVAQLSTPVASTLLEAADAAQAEAPSMVTTGASTVDAPATGAATDEAKTPVIVDESVGERGLTITVAQLSTPTAAALLDAADGAQAELAELSTGTTTTTVAPATGRASSDRRLDVRHTATAGDTTVAGERIDSGVVSPTAVTASAQLSSSFPLKFTADTATATATGSVESTETVDTDDTALATSEPATSVTTATAADAGGTGTASLTLAVPYIETLLEAADAAQAETATLAQTTASSMVTPASTQAAGAASMTTTPSPSATALSPAHEQSRVTMSSVTDVLSSAVALAVTQDTLDSVATVAETTGLQLAPQPLSVATEVGAAGSSIARSDVSVTQLSKHIDVAETVLRTLFEHPILFGQRQRPVYYDDVRGVDYETTDRGVRYYKS